MNEHSKGSLISNAEKFLQRTALGVALLAVTYGLSAANYLVDGAPAEYIDKLINGLGVLVLVVVAPPFVSYLWRQFKHRAACAETDSYIAQVFNRACMKAFSVTFVFLILLDPLVERVATQLPTGFYIKLVLAVSLLAFSVTFFLSMRDDDADSIDGFESGLNDVAIDDAKRGAS